MGTPIAVRPASPEDWPSAMELWQQAHIVRRNGRPLAGGQVERALRRLQDAKTLLLVAEDQDVQLGGQKPPAEALVGTALGVQGREDDGAGPPLPGLLHISMVSVAPDLWGRHIGRRLIESLLSEAGSLAYDRAQLWTHADNLRANRLYRVMGFRRSGRVRIDDWGELIVHYHRPIPSP
ncbi:GNAT family N-acetyltransferase [Phaeacidiphilus oryzae]|uniref:GNAT family N-acetyltransferase n=1 Tax=Phaeacidiphilus oryzae TaxID=348818 RepID=UPI000A7A616D|nr:GNAT family N-acetyltransferase [Phaeacidiphilus oryzae]